MNLSASVLSVQERVTRRLHYNQHKPKKHYYYLYYDYYYNCYYEPLPNLLLAVMSVVARGMMQNPGLTGFRGRHCQ